MIDSEADADANNTGWGTVDNEAGSYYHLSDWDDGVHYYANNKGLTYTFDEAYEVNTVAILSVMGASYNGVRIKCWNGNEEVAFFTAQISSKQDSKGRPYQVITFCTANFCTDT